MFLTSKDHKCFFSCFKQILKNRLCITCTRRLKKGSNELQFIHCRNTLSFFLPCASAMGSSTSAASSYDLSINYSQDSDFLPSQFNIHRLKMASIPISKELHCHRTHFSLFKIKIWQAQCSSNLFKAGLTSYHNWAVQIEKAISTARTYRRTEKKKPSAFHFMAWLGHILYP